MRANNTSREEKDLMALYEAIDMGGDMEFGFNDDPNPELGNPDPAIQNPLSSPEPNPGSEVINSIVDVFSKHQPELSQELSNDAQMTLREIRRGLHSEGNFDVDRAIDDFVIRASKMLATASKNASK